MTHKPRSIRPDDLEIVEQIPGIIGVARDADLKLIWCTCGFYRILDVVQETHDLKGSTLQDILTPSAAIEREKIQRQVMETGEVISHYQISADARVLCTIFPLDEQAFGHAGVLAIIKDAPIESRLCHDSDIPVLASPHLAQLNALSSRELEILHYIAKGMSTNDIASTLNRSSKTIEKQVNSIHTKLDTHSRAELVRYATERGIQSFTDEDWTAIVEGAKVLRRERRAGVFAN